VENAALIRRRCLRREAQDITVSRGQGQPTTDLMVSFATALRCEAYEVIQSVALPLGNTQHRSLTHSGRRISFA
jgi:hypothetical protein